MRMPELMTEISGVIVEVVAFNRVTSAMVWLKMSNRSPTTGGGVLSATPRRNLFLQLLQFGVFRENG